VKNDLILQNLRTLAEAGAHVIIRIPLVGGVNDHEENIRQTAEFLASLPGNGMDVHLLPYHAIAQHKYAKLGKENSFAVLEEPDVKSMERAIELFGEYGIRAQVGG
jgi:pyruvate formate lyase activating enzyme